MKKLVLAFAFVTLGSVAYAGRLNTDQMQQKATEATRDMANTLHLNEYEYIKLKAMNLQRISALNEILEHYGDNPALANTMSQEIELAYHKQLAEVFNPDQMKSFVAWQKATKTDYTSFLVE